MSFFSSNIVFFVIAVTLLALQLPYPTEARSVAAKMMCTKDPKSYWLRHACLDGFVINFRNKVLAQAEGLNQHDSRGKWCHIFHGRPKGFCLSHECAIHPPTTYKRFLLLHSIYISYGNVSSRPYHLVLLILLKFFFLLLQI